MSAAEATLQPDSGKTEVQTLYSDHHGWLQSWLRKKLGCSHRAADLAHDTFIRILTSTIPADLKEPRAYLTRVARNLVADHWRRQDVERAYLAAIAHLPEPEAPSPEARLLILESLCRIDGSLHALPALTRRVFLRSQLDGMVYADIAREMNLSLSTVNRHMGRAFLACLMAA